MYYDNVLSIITDNKKLDTLTDGRRNSSLLFVKFAEARGELEARIYVSKIL
jgi:hypothetical protein